MSAYKVASLKTETSRDMVNEPELWTRGGLEGLEIRMQGALIQIPRDVIMRLVISEVISNQIAALEQLEVEDCELRIIARQTPAS